MESGTVGRGSVLYGETRRKDKGVCSLSSSVGFLSQNEVRTECVEGDIVQVTGSFQNTGHKGTLAKFSFTSVFYVVKILCPFTWRELLIVNQWRLK